jgi:hypothetical protein
MRVLYALHTLIVSVRDRSINLQQMDCGLLQPDTAASGGGGSGSGSSAHTSSSHRSHKETRSKRRYSDTEQVTCLHTP